MVSKGWKTEGKGDAGLVDPMEYTFHPKHPESLLQLYLTWREKLTKPQYFIDIKTSKRIRTPITPTKKKPPCPHFLSVNRRDSVESGRRFIYHQTRPASHTSPAHKAKGSGRPPNYVGLGPSPRSPLINTPLRTQGLLLVININSTIPKG